MVYDNPHDSELLPPQTPPEDLDPLFYTLESQQQLIRIYKNKPNRNAVGFNYKGPFGRFDHHQGSWQDPTEDSERAVYYASPVINSDIRAAMSGSIAEVFGDRGDQDCRTMAGMSAKKICLVETADELNLLDLRKNGAMRVGTIVAVATGNLHRRITQAWSRYFYENETAFSRIDGIIYPNCHNEEPSAILYQRAEGRLRCIEDLRLNDPTLRTLIQDIAKELRIAIPPEEWTL